MFDDSNGRNINENQHDEAVVFDDLHLYAAEIDHYFNTVGNADFMADDKNESLASRNPSTSNALVDSVPTSIISTSSILASNELMANEISKRQKFDNEDTTFHEPNSTEILPIKNGSGTVTWAKESYEIPQNISSSDGVLNDHATFISSAFSSVTPQPKSSYVYDSTHETRMEFLTRSPRLMQNCVNGYDFKGLQTLIDEICLEDCKFKTPALSQELVGRHMIMKYWESALTAIPDLILVYKSPEVHYRVISLKALSVGTVILNGNTDDYLWNFLKYGEVSDSDNELKLRVDALIEAKKQISFTYKSVHHFVLNDSKTHIERFIATRRSIEVEECTSQVTSTK